MYVSLNWVKKYVDLPKDLSVDQLIYDLTMRTVEVEGYENPADKYHDIVVGKILEVKPHPNADKLRICITDIGEEEPVQIVCGGCNLYDGEHVVVCRPGAEVIWHGEGEPVVIKEGKLRGEYSYGMICNAAEVYLADIFPPESDEYIVDLNGQGTPGQNIADFIGMNDIVIEIDNKSLTNRPDLWGHYGIAREIAAIYKLDLKPLADTTEDIQGLADFPIEIQAPDKCQRYAALEIQNVDAQTEAPLWMKTALMKAGLRSINAIVDITNYVMLDVGQPTHAFDRTHVTDKIIVRNAAPGEKLELLDHNQLDLTTYDLVICDAEEPMALAGIRGGRKDSILPDTTSVLLEVANFTAQTIRKTGKRFDEKTDASIRYEKGLDTERVDQGLAEAITLFKQLFPNVKFTAYGDVYPAKTERAEVKITKDFMDTRLGKEFTEEDVKDTLTRLGFDVDFDGTTYTCLAPTWRSTGDIAIKDDILDEMARLHSFESFSAKPLPVKFEHAVNQPKESVDRRIREYLAFRCGFNEVFTYPWVDEHFMKAAGVNMDSTIRLATPPSPEQANLRPSLVPGMLQTAVSNLRYFDSFRVFESAEVFQPGIYHESSEDETLPLQKHYVTGMIVGNDPKTQFFQAKGVIENLARTCQVEPLSWKQAEHPAWADDNVYLNIMAGKELIGTLGLVRVSALAEAGIKHAQIALFEFDEDMLTPYKSRDNEFQHLPVFPLVEKDLSVIVDESVTWQEIENAIAKHTREVKFVEEYRGSQIPEGKKSIMLTVKIGSDKGTMKAKQIDKQMNKIVRTLENRVGAQLRDA